MSSADNDGGDRTAGEQDKSCDMRSSGGGVGANFRINDLLSAFVELAPVSVTVSSEDNGETCWAFNSCLGYAFGVTAEGELKARVGSFWSTSFSLRGIGAADYTTPAGNPWHVSYDEFGFALDGKLGGTVGDTRIYGGLRISGFDGDLADGRADGTNVFTREFDPDSSLAIFVGARASTPGTDAFVEMSLLRSFGFAAGVAFKF